MIAGPWAVGGRRAGKTLALVEFLKSEINARNQRITQLEAALIHEYNEEWDVGDGITDAAKVQFLIDRIPK